MAKTKTKSVIENKSKVFQKDLNIASTKNALLVESKHRQIIDGACRSFFTKGYHPTTIRDIAMGSGMSMGQLYHYISSKDDVLYLTHKHMQEVWYKHLKITNVAQIDDPVQRFTHAIYRTLEFMVKNRKLIQFVYTESKYLDKKHLRIVLQMDYNNVIGFWRQQLQTLSEHVPLKGDLDFLASLIVYILVFLPLRGWTLRGKPVENSVDSLKDFLLKGLGVIR